MYSVDVYLRVRRAVMVEGRSIREVSREYGLHRDTVRKMLAHSVPPGYRRQNPPKRPKLEPYTGVIDRILEGDLRRPRKQRHTAKRIFERLQDEYGFGGGYTAVKDYVREDRRQTREMFVPPVPSAGPRAVRPLARPWWSVRPLSLGIFQMRISPWVWFRISVRSLEPRISRGDL